MPPQDYRLSNLTIGRDEADRAVLRLGGGWLHPCHLVGAAATAELACAAGPLTVVRPNDFNRANYAARMRLGQVLDELGADHDLPVVRENDLSTELFEIRRLRTEDDARGLARLVADKIEPVDPRAAGVLWESITEIGINVRDHAESAGWGAAQTMSAAQEVLFAIADCGLGLLETLRGRGATTHRDGLALALSGTSRHDAADRGRGLTSTLSAVSGLGGDLYVVSGTATVTATTNDRRHLELARPFQGTLVQGRVPTAARR